MRADGDFEGGERARAAVELLLAFVPGLWRVRLALGLEGEKRRGLLFGGLALELLR